MNKSQSIIYGEMITVYLDNGWITVDDLLPIMMKGASAITGEKKEKLFTPEALKRVDKESSK